MLRPMTKHLILATAIATASATFTTVQAAEPECPPLLNHEFTKLNSADSVNLCQQFQGQVLLVVNTASQCGFTPQYEGLETLYQTYKDQGLPLSVSRPMTSSRTEAMKKTRQKSATWITA